MRKTSVLEKYYNEGYDFIVTLYNIAIHDLFIKENKALKKGPSNNSKETQIFDHKPKTSHFEVIKWVSKRSWASGYWSIFPWMEQKVKCVSEIEAIPLIGFWLWVSTFEHVVFCSSSVVTG